MTEFVAPRGGRRRRRRAARAGAGDQRRSPTATPFLVCELWRALVETRVVEVVDGAIRLTRPLAELGTPESVREVVSQRLSRLAPGTTDLLELAATAGAEFELDVLRGAAGLDGARAARRARRGGAQRDDRGAPVARARLPLHARARAPGAVRPAHRACGARSSTCASARRSRRADGRSRPRRSPTSRTTSPPRRRSAAPGAAVEYNLRAARAADRRARLRRGGGAAAHRARARDRRARAERAEVLLELGHASHRAGKALDALEAFTAAAEIARELGDARAARARGDRLRGRVLAARDRRPGRGRAARGGGGRARRRELGAARRAARRARARARLPGRARARRRRPRPARSRWPGGWTIAPGSRRCWCAPTGRAGRARSRRSSRCSPRPRDSARSSATPRSAPRRWPGACPPSSRSATSTSARREVAALRATAEQTAQPFMLHVAEHYGSAIALCDGRLDEAEARGAALARVEPAADRPRRVRRLRDPDVRHPPRAGAAGRARAR